ncbi:MAG TPA: IS4 family transposase [Thermomicrobiales bacterium]|nr:IS4 family transposase [Thermomicrobiales bacterium]
MPASPTTSTVGPEPVIGDVRQFLQAAVGQLEPEPTHTGRRGRPRILPSTCLWAAMLVCIMDGFSSQLALWRRLTVIGLWEYPRFLVSDAAVYKRLEQERTDGLAMLLTQITALLDQRLAPWLPQVVPPLATFATDIVALDETTLDPLARSLPPSTKRPAQGRVLPGKLALLFDVRRQLVRRVQIITEATQNEKVAARDLVAGLSRGTLVLVDLGYFAFQFFDDLTNQGVWWVTRVREKTSYTVIQTFAQHGDTFDGLIWLGAYRSDRAAHPVRLVQFRHGATLHRYLTNVCDPQQLPLDEVAQLYARRWDIEMAFQLIKQHLGLSLWWSTKDRVIHQQLYGILIIAQIVQALRLEIAGRAGVEVFDVSVPLLVRYLPVFAARGEDPLALFVERGRLAGFIRPSRRIGITAPDPPLDYAMSIDARPVLRTPRYAGRKCTRPEAD